MTKIHFATPGIWAGFVLFVLLMLALDLFVFGGKKSHRVSVKEATIWVGIWAALALIFAAILWFYLQAHVGHVVANAKTMEFLTGYIIEQSLSIDNIFVFVMIFNYFAIPSELQRRVLLFGVLGAIIMRALMIVAGTALVREFAWIFYLFGAFLVVTGVKMLLPGDEKKDLASNPLIQWLKKHLRITPQLHGELFYIRENGLIWFTPLLLALILVEVSDVIFAVDSIPAIFAITTDPFIVFTSNIFAILGLRAMYFLLADMANRFALLKYGLAIVLTFVGVKMLIAPWLHIPAGVSLIVVFVVLLLSVALSVRRTRRDDCSSSH